MPLIYKELLKVNKKEIKNIIKRLPKIFEKLNKKFP